MKTNVNIWNHSFTISCEETEIESVTQAQEILNESIHKVKKSIATQDRERIVLMAALSSVQTLLIENTNSHENYSELMLKLEDVLK